MTIAYRYLLFTMGLLIGIASIWYLGYSKGKQTAQTQYLAKQIKQLETVITTTQLQTKKAQEASAKYEQLISVKTEADLKTSKELNNALKTTKNIRSDCVFDERIMQQLDNARQRAATATHTSKANGVLPSTRSDER